MSVRLALLRSGEYVISDINEVIKDDRMIGYVLTKPCTVEVKGTVPVSRSILSKSNASKKTLSINLFPWIPFSPDEDILIPMDWVITLVTPFEDLLETYETDVLNYEQEDSETDNSDEQSDTDQSD